MLKKLRIALEGVFFICFLLLFSGCFEEGSDWFGWIAKLQFLPAVLALNLGVIAGLVLLTLIFGRIYCSVICPLGIMQDIFSAHRVGGRKGRQSWSKEKKVLRYGVMVAFFALLIAGINAAVVLLAPYSIIGRFFSSLTTGSTVTLAISGVTLLLIIVLAATGGRTWCNTICPVGTVLSFLSRYAIFRPMIDADKCKNCKQCEKHCKASCINVAEHKIDHSRCVDCFDCIGTCKFDALKYRFAYGKKNSSNADSAAKEGIDEGRRAVLGTMAVFGTAAIANAAKKVDGGMSEVKEKKVPERAVKPVPFGARDIKHFQQHCTACQLCVLECPNKVLSPSTDFERFLQPEMNFEQGWCRPECTKCSQVCPAGAIKEITPEEKTQIHIGKAVIDIENCLAWSGKLKCKGCSIHCPTGAISMVTKEGAPEDAPLVPVVDAAICIGCGACENLCPGGRDEEGNRTWLTNIHVEGYEEHVDHRER